VQRKNGLPWVSMSRDSDLYAERRRGGQCRQARRTEQTGAPCRASPAGGGLAGHGPLPKATPAISAAGWRRQGERRQALDRSLAATKVKDSPLVARPGLYMALTARARGIDGHYDQRYFLRPSLLP
jgi:hypothetical protein